MPFLQCYLESTVSKFLYLCFGFYDFSGKNSWKEIIDCKILSRGLASGLFFEEPLNKFQTGTGSVTKLCNTKLMLVFNLRGETLIKLLEFWSFSRKFYLTQNEFEKLNYLELYILGLLSNARFGVFSKSIETTLSIFTMCSDLLAKRIKLKFYQVKSHISQLLVETTETSASNLVRSKMKLFPKVINGLKAVTLKVNKKNVSIFKLKLLPLVS